MTRCKASISGKKYFLLSVVLIMLCCFAIFITPQSYADDTEQQIRVGIKSGSVTDATTTLSSTSGYKLGIVENGIFFETGVSIPFNTLYVIKNTRVIGDSIEVPGETSGAYFGSYHLQIGPVFENYSEMKTLLDQLSSVIPDLYPAYDNGWHVYVGTYRTPGERASYLAQVVSLIPDLEVSDAPVNDKAVMAVDTSKVYLYYDTSDASFAFMPQTEGDLIGFESRKYRGAIGIKRYTNSDPTVINYIALEKYLYGVLPREMSGDWPLEALKAQAVAARNYALTALNKHNTWGFDLCNLQDCQVYGGASVERPGSNDAVDETLGRLLTYDNKLISAFYHSNSGGRTENSEYIWTSVVPYLKSVADPFSLDQPSAKWVKSYSPSQIDELLKLKSINIGPIIGIYVTKVSPNGRALETVFVGRDGEYVATKEKARFLLGSYDIRSTWYSIGSGSALSVESSSGITELSDSGCVIESATGQTTITGVNSLPMMSALGTQTFKPAPTGQIVFTGYGFGHGVGMSQWGAKKMAELGMDYVQILTHYYTNTVVQ